MAFRYRSSLLAGLFESGMFPGCFYLLSSWYLRTEAQRRYSFFFGSTTLAGAFAGLLAAAISKMEGIAGYAGWRWVCRLDPPRPRQSLTEIYRSSSSKESSLVLSAPHSSSFFLISPRTANGSQRTSGHSLSTVFAENKVPQLWIARRALRTSQMYSRTTRSSSEASCTLA